MNINFNAARNTTPDFSLFSGLEIAGVAMWDANTGEPVGFDCPELTNCERIDPDDFVTSNPAMVTLYGRLKDGGCEALHDFYPPFNLDAIGAAAQDLVECHSSLKEHGVMDLTLPEWNGISSGL